MESTGLSQEGLEEWRRNPATQALKECADLMMDRQLQAMAEAYLSGRPYPESQRLALHRTKAWVEDFFTADIDEIEAAMRE